MHIGIDATCWSNRRGYGRFTRALVSALLEEDRSNRYTLFVDHESEAFPFCPGAEICRIATNTPSVEAAGANSSRSLHDLWAVSAAIRRARVDLIFFPADFTYVPLMLGAPRIVTIHDAIAESFPELAFPTLRSKLLYRTKRILAARQSRLVLTVSEYSRRSLMREFGIEESRIRVVSEAADPIFRPLEGPTRDIAQTRWGISSDARCLLFVGGFSPHKNLFMLLDVFGELIGQEVFGDLQLVLVGDYEKDLFHSCYPKLAERVREAPFAGRVQFTGRIEDENLVLLLNRADVLVLPSLSEGFGLPGAEAAACGTPVLATTESPMPELLGEGCIGIDPHDRVGWRRAIERVLTDPALRAGMGEAALAAASQMSWRNSARQLLSVFNEFRSESNHGAAA